jgi:hypothetical protein
MKKERKVENISEPRIHCKFHHKNHVHRKGNQIKVMKKQKL